MTKPKQKPNADNPHGDQPAAHHRPLRGWIILTGWGSQKQERGGGLYKEYEEECYCVRQVMAGEHGTGCHLHLIGSAEPDARILGERVALAML